MSPDMSNQFLGKRDKNRWNARPRRVRVSATTAWTNERSGYLKARWSQGASARQIAKELGGISRSAVIGKVHRLGIAAFSPRMGPLRERASEREYRCTDEVLLERMAERGIGATQQSQRPQLPTWISEAEPYVDDPIADADVPLSQRRSLLELDRGTCRWPIGDPASPHFSFCGAEPSAGKPYCTAHCARAYRPPPQTMSRVASANAPSSALIRRAAGADTA
ncbi:MAG: GcrA family cell cycle regulator [Xanthobacteraceae bacterium]